MPQHIPNLSTSSMLLVRKHMSSKASTNDPPHLEPLPVHPVHSLYSLPHVLSRLPQATTRQHNSMQHVLCGGLLVTPLNQTDLVACLVLLVGKEILGDEEVNRGQT